MDKTQWDLIRILEEAIGAKQLDHRACNLLCSFVETLFQKGLIERYILHNICNIGWSCVDAKWEALHEFAKQNQAAIESLSEYLAYEKTP